MVTPEADSTLVSVLTSLLSPLDFGVPDLEPFIRLHAQLRYDLSAPSGAGAVPLQASVPLTLLPNLVLGDAAGATTPAVAAQQIGAALAAKRGQFAGRNGNLYLDLSLTLFGSEAGQQVPLVDIDGLLIDVTGLPLSWWSAAH